MSKKPIKITIIISRPPFGVIDGKEGVDLALVCAAFEQKVNLIFVDEGIFHLLNNQNDTKFLDKNHDKQLKALEFYDIETIYAETESLERFGLSKDNLIDNTELLNRKNINQLVTSSLQTVSF